MRFITVQHEIGKLSRCAVLDVGLKCPHSCEFCYYSFLDKSDNQFKGIRQAPFRPFEECTKALDFFVTQGFDRIDITGGEPLYHPKIVDIVRYAEKEKNLRVRLITLGQLFERNDFGTGKTLLDALLEDAGISDFLFSMHAVDPGLFNQITKGNFVKLENAMDMLDAAEFEYCTNTVVYANNAWHIPDVAKYIVSKKRRVRICNFITMNAYYSWATGKAFGVQARYGDIIEPIRAATKLLEDAGIGVNVRYGCYCGMKGLEKNFVGCMGVLFDPYEWRTTTQNPFDIIARDEEDAVILSRRRLPLNNKIFPSKCKSCAVLEICDGVDKNYFETYGDEDISPVEGEPITDIVYFRKDNPSVFMLKQKVRDDGSLMLPSYDVSAVSVGKGWVSTIKAIMTGMRRFCQNKLCRRIYLLEIPRKLLSGSGVTLIDTSSLTGYPNIALMLTPNASVQYSLNLPRGAIFSSQIRLFPVATDKAATTTGGSSLSLSFAIKGSTSSKMWTWQASRSKCWTPIKLSLADWQEQDVLLTFSCNSNDSQDGTQLALLEPIVYARKPAGYILKYVFLRYKYLGLRGTCRKLKSYARFGVRDVRPE